jgi:hypothetical protein
VGSLEALADSLFRVRLGCDIEKALVRFGVLDDRRSLSLDGQHDGPFGFSELFQKLAQSGGGTSSTIACLS